MLLKTSSPLYPPCLIKASIKGEEWNLSYYPPQSPGFLSRGKHDVGQGQLLLPLSSFPPLPSCSSPSFPLPPPSFLPSFFPSFFILPSLFPSFLSSFPSPCPSLHSFSFLSLLSFFFLNFIAYLLSILSFSNFFLFTYDTGDHVSWFARTVLGYVCCLYVIVPAHYPLYYQRVLITNYIVRLSDKHKEN